MNIDKLTNTALDMAEVFENGFVPPSVTESGTVDDGGLDYASFTKLSGMLEAVDTNERAWVFTAFRSILENRGVQWLPEHVQTPRNN